MGPAAQPQHSQGPCCLAAPLRPALGFPRCLQAQDLAGRSCPWVVLWRAQWGLPQCSLGPRACRRLGERGRAALQRAASTQAAAELLPGVLQCRRSCRRHAGLGVSRAGTGGLALQRLRVAGQQSSTQRFQLPGALANRASPPSSQHPTETQARSASCAKRGSSWVHVTLRARDPGQRDIQPKDRTEERRPAAEGLVGRSLACPHPGGGHLKDLVVGSLGSPTVGLNLKCGVGPGTGQGQGTCVCASVPERGGQLRTSGTVTQSIFKLWGGEKAAALEPVTGRGVSGDLVRFKDAQDRCVVWALVPWRPARCWS